jgi:hypothetical protein
MFQLTRDEAEVLTSQIAIPKPGRGGRRTLPHVFTEQGVAMLATVLNSDRAIAVNIAIMRTFVRLRQILATHKESRQATRSSWSRPPRTAKEPIGFAPARKN